LLIINFINEISRNTIFQKVIVTGSSITASIRDILEPNNTIIINRVELEIFSMVSATLSNVVLGDYTTVSPNYSDVLIPGQLMRKVTAPKVMYAFGNQLYIMRGSALEGHPRGNKQYNDLSAILVNQNFFRSSGFSFGDLYITDKANNIGADATPSTIPKPLINAHITFMLNSYV
jgi:hypothetical protein